MPERLHLATSVDDPKNITAELHERDDRLRAARSAKRKSLARLVGVMPFIGGWPQRELQGVSRRATQQTIRKIQRQINVPVALRHPKRPRGGNAYYHPKHILTMIRSKSQTQADRMENLCHPEGSTTSQGPTTQKAAPTRATRQFVPWLIRC